MLAVRESAEHHFITTLQDLRSQPQGWIVIRLGLSRNLQHHTLMKDPSSIGLMLKIAKEKAENIFENLAGRAHRIRNAIAYLFPDHDIVLLVQPQNPEEKKCCRGPVSGSDSRFGKRYLRL
ncbi:MAG: hypothetical protein LRY54_02495 [Alphaproteobacteria bacterium]|nr:hypothetical protein [Alphaproteobacteria bacterium]